MSPRASTHQPDQDYEASHKHIEWRQTPPSCHHTECYHCLATVSTVRCASHTPRPRQCPRFHSQRALPPHARAAYSIMILFRAAREKTCWPQNLRPGWVLADLLTGLENTTCASSSGSTTCKRQPPIRSYGPCVLSPRPLRASRVPLNSRWTSPWWPRKSRGCPWCIGLQR